MFTQTRALSAKSENDCGSRWYHLGRRILPLRGARLAANAEARIGFDDAATPAVRTRLSVLAWSLESEANLHFVGRFLARKYLQDLLETRLRLTREWLGSSPADMQPITRPVFITGMPRSGSTFLHELLAEDPGNRAPRIWEVMFPLAARFPGTRAADRAVRNTAACLWWFRRLAPRADLVCPLRATTPQECIAIQSYTLLSQEFPTMFRVPTYEAFLNLSDFTPAYKWEKRFLQHLQSSHPSRQWVLKAPDHIFSLDALFQVFPDAVVIQTHRNPFDVLKSSIQLTEV